MARWYAEQHLRTDPGIAAVHYLPKGADEREIRLVEVNSLMSDRTDEAIEPIDFGIDMGSEGEHLLFVLDVTPEQWERIRTKKLALPDGWTIDGALHFRNE